MLSALSVSTTGSAVRSTSAAAGAARNVMLPNVTSERSAGRTVYSSGTPSEGLASRAAV